MCHIKRMEVRKADFYNKKTNLDVRDFHDSDNRSRCGMVCAAQRDPVGCC